MAIRDFFKSKQKSDKQIDETTPYYRIGGEEKVRELANRFYDVMENDTYAAELLSIHPQPLDRIRHVFFLYLSLWLGGPDIYQQEFGHPRLRARHLPFTVSPALKEQWMYCMRKAMMTTVSDVALAQKLLQALDQLAEHMINTK
ncbi:hemoglobin-like oxygen-binding protein [Alteromonas australica]|jgi:hemoglobin|uniref:Hemoglobin-like oxygen-binding protein n=1 Tax=Alteromonas australica TaxID=589873 RepID=A0A075P1G4_9ALTE|nr:group II truncated hemoglobin [Alteromonas australica]AIF97227.1 hemoglobin-like oxygen-binding protein [Alteromonas australica]AJP42361.1 hemoglobin-like oxygen-binding protein [Alteromonas australica]|tara:strand:- start:289 stop:720 length:432 start_codon:yes stop_codon:yes gene_type:complete